MYSSQFTCVEVDWSGITHASKQGLTSTKYTTPACIYQHGAQAIRTSSYTRCTDVGHHLPKQSINMCHLVCYPCSLLCVIHRLFARGTKHILVPTLFIPIRCVTCVDQHITR
jgi:hypothetical protein